MIPISIPSDTRLYEKVKKYVYAIYKKPSAYRSGALVKLYKKLGGKYHIVYKKGNKNDELPLHRWFQEKWKDVSPKKYSNKEHYPLYRPTKRINSKTPTTYNEISKKEIEKQYKLKQKIRGESNLPKFKKKKI